jgi:DNA polymerase III psi subunit
MSEDFFFDLPALQIENNEGNSILVLLKKKDSKMENIELIKNILKPLQLTLENIQMEILEENVILGKSLPTYEKIICFGINPSEIGLNINFRAYTIHPMGKTKMLFSHALNDLAPNAEYKKLLWQSLQLMFDLNKKS